MAYALRYGRVGTGWAAAQSMHEYMATPSRVLDVSQLYHLEFDQPNYSFTFKSIL